MEIHSTGLLVGVVIGWGQAGDRLGTGSVAEGTSSGVSSANP